MSSLTHYMKKVSVGFLLLLFLGSMGSITLFYHTHYVNGYRITHSHPYKDAPDSGKHSHSSADFSLIDSLSSGVIMVIALGFVPPVYFFLIGIINLSNESSTLRNSFVVSLRGPPTA